MFGAANSLVGSASGYLDTSRHANQGDYATVSPSSDGGFEGGIYPRDSNLAFIGNGPGGGIGDRTELHVAVIVLAALGLLVGIRSLGFRSIIAVSK